MAVPRPPAGAHNWATASTGSRADQHVERRGGGEGGAQVLREGPVAPRRAHRLTAPQARPIRATHPHATARGGEVRGEDPLRAHPATAPRPRRTARLCQRGFEHYGRHRGCLHHLGARSDPAARHGQAPAADVHHAGTLPGRRLRHPCQERNDRQHGQRCARPPPESTQRHRVHHGSASFRPPCLPATDRRPHERGACWRPSASPAAC
jgi:hypothetical protein